MKKKYLLVMCVLAMTNLTACSQKKSTVNNIEETVLIDPITIDLDTATASMQDIYTAKSYSGEVNPSVTELYFPDDGTFLEYSVLLGDPIEKGTVIAKTDDKNLQEKIDTLQKEYDLFLNDYTYEKSKIERQIEISNLDLAIMNNSLIEAYEIDHKTFYDTVYLRVQIEDVKASIEKQELQLAQFIEIFTLDDGNYQRKIQHLKENMGTNVIVAPMDGTMVAQKAYSPGDIIDSTKAAIAYGDSNNVVVQCDYISETSANSANRIVAYIGDHQYDLTYVPYDLAVLNSLQLKDETLVSTFTINNMDDTIQIGSFAMVVVISDEKENVLSVPSSAIYKDSISTYVYKMVSDTKTKVNVTIGIQDEYNTEIVEGLLEGDVIYVGK